MPSAASPGGGAAYSVLAPPPGERARGGIVGVGQRGPRVGAGRQVRAGVLGEFLGPYRIDALVHRGGIDDAERAGVDPREAVDRFGQRSDVDGRREHRFGRVAGRLRRRVVHRGGRGVDHGVLVLFPGGGPGDRMLLGDRLVVRVVVVLPRVVLVAGRFEVAGLVERQWIVVVPVVVVA